MLLWELITRYSFGGRRAGFSRVVARTSLLGMVLGVASLITVMSVMNGFSAELHERILKLIPHAKVLSLPGSPMTSWQGLADELMAKEGVIGAAPFVEDTVLLRAWGRQRGAVITGIDIDAQRHVSALHEQIIEGSLDSIRDVRFAVVLGSNLARLMGVSVGDRVDVVLPALSVTPLGVFPRMARLEVVAEFQVGTDLDANQAWVSLETAQRLFNRRGVDGLQLEFESRDLAVLSAAEFSEALPQPLKLETWQQSQGSLFSAIRMEKWVVGFLLFAVIAVAAFNIISTLTMSVTEKTREIAVLRTMGLSARSILWLFTGHGMLLGVVGIALGAVVGILLSLNLSGVTRWLEQLLGVHLFDPRVYYIGTLPSELHAADVCLAIGGALVLSLLATMYPAWRAARIDPIEALNRG